MARRPVAGASAVLLALSVAAACDGGTEPVTLTDARESVESLVPQLQEAFALGEDVEWSGPDRETLAAGDDGTCQWRPGRWSIPLQLEEGDPSWPDRRERVNEVLAEHELPEVGEPEYTGGAAYGFETDGPAGGRLRIDSWKGDSTISLHSLRVAVDGRCDDSALIG